MIIRHRATMRVPITCYNITISIAGRTYSNIEDIPYNVHTGLFYFTDIKKYLVDKPVSDWLYFLSQKYQKFRFPYQRG